MSLRVIDGGFMTIVQDAGRFGYQHLGVPSSVPMDQLAYWSAHALVGNPPELALLEFTLIGPTLLAQADCLVAYTGCGYAIKVDGIIQPGWTSLLVKKGETISFEKTQSGVWGYLAIQGGIHVPLVLGSRATYLRGRFGGVEGRALQPNDLLELGCQKADQERFANRTTPYYYRPKYTQHPRLETIQGPQAFSFTFEGMNTLYNSAYAVTPASDKMGYRLDGPVVEHAKSADILSDGMQPGSVQIPASGLPIVMMGDSATSGGYTKIAALTTVARSLLAQCEPGNSQVRFDFTSIEAAQTCLAKTARELTTVEIADDEDEEDMLRFVTA